MIFAVVVVTIFTVSQVEGSFFLQIFSDFSVEKFLRWENGKLTFLLKETLWSWTWQDLGRQKQKDCCRIRASQTWGVRPSLRKQNKVQLYSIF